MKLCLGIALALTALTVVQAQDYSRVRAKLQGTTSIREQHICLSPSGTPEVSLLVNMSITNVGNYPIIIARESGESSLYVAHTSEDARAKHYEYKARGDLWDFPPRLQTDVPDSSYIILKPKESYVRQLKLWGLYFESLMKYSHYSGAPHFVQVDLWTIDSLLVSSVSSDGRINISEKHLRSRWKTQGYLWLDGVTTEPMLVQFPSAATLTKCGARAA